MVDSGHQIEPADTLEVRDLEALRALTDPLRLRLVDLLRQAAHTAKELAAAMEVDQRSLYYHLALLERHGLIRVVGTRMISGIQERRYRATAYLFLYKDLAAPGLPEGEAGTLGVVVSSFFAITAEEIRDSVAAGRIVLVGAPEADRALTSTWELLRISPADAASLAGRLTALLAEYQSESEDLVASERGGEKGRSDDGRQTFRFLSTLFPTVGRGERRVAQAATTETTTAADLPPGKGGRTRKRQDR